MLEWPVDEVEAVRRYLQAFWRTALSSFPLEERLPGIFEFETILCSVARTGEPLDECIEAWTRDQSAAATSHLVQFATVYASDLFDNDFFQSSFWSESQAQGDALRIWLTRPEIIDRLERSAHLVRKDDYEHLYRPALNTLRQHRRIESDETIQKLV